MEFAIRALEEKLSSQRTYTYGNTPSREVAELRDALCLLYIENKLLKMKENQEDN